MPFAVAALETALNANPFLKSLFCYDDMALMLTFGTFCYGTAFVCIGPVWLSIDERPTRTVTATTVLIRTAAAMYAVVLLLDLYRYQLAPHLTQVVDGANGLRDFATSCLVPPNP